jgi:hypothetical protein
VGGGIAVRLSGGGEAGAAGRWRAASEARGAELHGRLDEERSRAELDDEWNMWEVEDEQRSRAPPIARRVA